MRHDVTRDQRAPWRRASALATATVLALAMAGCGDDDNAGGTSAATSTTLEGGSGGTSAAPPTSGGADSEAYCELARELDEQEEFPSGEQIRALIETAPEEIREDMEFVGARFLEAMEDGGEQAVLQLFSDPEVQQRFGPIDEFDVDECGIEAGPPEPDGLSDEVDESAQRVDVVATEYQFEFASPGSGAASFVMVNQGEEPHVMSIAKLNDGTTLEDAMASDDPGAVIEWEASSAVSNPGDEAVLTFEDLPTGTYAMVCFIPAPDGEPHAAKGMAVEFAVE